VSDQVAILNHGRLVAQAPIDELLDGGKGAVYTITMKGDPQAAQARITGQSWVENIDVSSTNGQISWQVNVTDEETAEERLLPLMIGDEHCQVIEFGQKKYELEEVFMNIVEGGEHV
jgi:ABC-2 type transport system ATP-binding protein